MQFRGNVPLSAATPPAGPTTPLGFGSGWGVPHLQGGRPLAAPQNGARPYSWLGSEFGRDGEGTRCRPAALLYLAPRGPIESLRGQIPDSAAGRRRCVRLRSGSEPLCSLPWQRPWTASSGLQTRGSRTWPARQHPADIFACQKWDRRDRHIGIGFYTYTYIYLSSTIYIYIYIYIHLSVDIIDSPEYRQISNPTAPNSEEITRRGN